MSNVFRMVRLRRFLGWLIVAVLVLFAVILLGANLYVQSQPTHARIQQELSQRLGMSLRIDRISVTPWGGLKLTGITIPQVDAQQAFLRAKHFSLRVRFRSIFSRPLIINEVALVHPVVTWVQNDSGKWRLPLTRPPEEAAGERSETTAASVSPSAVSPTPAPEVEPSAAPVHQPAAPAQVRRVNLVNGNFQFLDRQGKNVARFEGVTFSSAVRLTNVIRGEARIDKVSLRDRVFLTNMRSAVRYAPEKLDFSDMSAQVARGKLSGSFSMEPQEVDSPFHVNTAFRQVHADQLLADAGGARDMIQGTLEGTLEADGKIADANALTGTGIITLNNGEVRQFPLLAAIGQLLRIEELTQLDLEQAEAKYRLAGQNVFIDEVNLRSANLQLTGSGSVALDGKLALNSSLIINDKIRAQLFRAIRDNFVATAPGQYSLDFHVTGTLDRPKTDLIEKAVGANLKDLSGIIDALLGRNKQKKKKDVDVPAASPSPTTP